MRKICPQIDQKGYTWIFFLLGLVLVVMILLPPKYSALPPETDNSGPIYCREFIKDPNAPRIDLPSYTSSGVDESNLQRYKLVKKNVPVTAYYFADTHHFVQPFKKEIVDPSSGKKYLMKVPNGENGQSYPIPTEDGNQFFKFVDYGLVYLFHLKDDGTPVIVDKFTRVDGVPQEVALVDLYIAEDKEIPEWVLKCFDTGPNGQTENIVYERREMVTPAQNNSPDQEQLQLQYFILQKYKLMMQAWWTPHCKPAVYLYPKKPMLVNVKVKPNGFLTYVDPLYDAQKGWTVLANPDGTLINQSADRDNQKLYDYLYFESKIKDQLITKPEKGWIVSFSALEKFYNDTLPQLGFNQKQQTDFIEFWQKTLPESPYYFVGLVSPAEIDTYESLEITPKPDQVNRVRFYFEPRQELNQIEAPTLADYYGKISPDAGFTVFEWGGLFKRDMSSDHSFTCSM